MSGYLQLNLGEKDLIKEIISNQITDKILEEEADLDTLKVAEKKIQYLKSKQLATMNH